MSISEVARACDAAGRSGEIPSRVAEAVARVDAACLAAGRPHGDARILLATKTQSEHLIRVAIGALLNLGCPKPILLGENRVQELVAKSAFLSEFANSGLIGAHLIGPLQRNKVNAVLASPCALIETIDSLGLAAAISQRAERAGREMGVLVQVNVSGEGQKAGCRPEVASELAVAVAQLPALSLRGFMCIGPRPTFINDDDGATPSTHKVDAGSNPGGPPAALWYHGIANISEISAAYRLLRDIRDAVIISGEPGTASATELSMGMSSDLELAIAQGATIIRLGTAIFGPRPPIN